MSSLLTVPNDHSGILSWLGVVGLTHSWYCLEIVRGLWPSREEQRLSDVLQVVRLIIFPVSQQLPSAIPSITKIALEDELTLLSMHSSILLLGTSQKGTSPFAFETLQHVVVKEVDLAACCIVLVSSFLFYPCATSQSSFETSCSFTY